MKKLLILSLTTIFFISCGTGSDSKPDETMNISQLYTLKKGDQILKTDMNTTTLIKVYHTDKSDESLVELLEGNATIIRK